MKEGIDNFTLHTKNFRAFFESYSYNSYSVKIYFLTSKLPKLKTFNLKGSKLEVKHYIYSIMLSLEDFLTEGGALLENSEQLLFGEYNIGIFVDFPNIDIAVRESQIHQYPNINLIKSFITLFGFIKDFRLYGDWGMLKGQLKYLKTIEGVKLIHEPHLKLSNGKKKDTVDMRMAFDIGLSLKSHPEINLYVIITGDADFLPILREIKKRGKKVIIIAEKYSLSSNLKKKFTNIITYQELLGIFTMENLSVSKSMYEGIV